MRLGRAVVVIGLVAASIGDAGPIRVGIRRRPATISSETGLVLHLAEGAARAETTERGQA